MKERLLKNWATIVFNVAETSLIIIFGIILKLKITEIVLVILLFGFTRIATKGGIHYKSWVKCLAWSLFLTVTLFILVKVDMRIAITMTIFSGLVTSKKADIRDWSMYRNTIKERKYRELEYYILENRDSNKLKKFEKILTQLNETYSKRYKVDFYKVYELYFLKDSSFDDIIRETNLYDNHGVTKVLDIIFFSFNTYMATIGEVIKEEEQNDEKELTSIS